MRRALGYLRGGDLEARMHDLSRAKTISTAQRVIVVVRGQKVMAFPLGLPVSLRSCSWRMGYWFHRYLGRWLVCIDSEEDSVVLRTGKFEPI